MIIGRLRPVSAEPALLLGNVLVIADLHLGIEAETDSEQVAERAIRETVNRIGSLMEKTSAERLVIAGDTGHILPASKNSSPIGRAVHARVDSAALDLGKRFDAVFLSGNHDGSLSIRTEKELIIDEVGIFHGHRWPSGELMECKTLVAGHSHPVIVFEDKLGCRTRQRIWVKGKPTDNLLRRYGKAEGNTAEGNIEMIIMPAFSDFTGGWNVKKSFEGHGPAFEKDMFKIETAYLLNGTEITI